ncbi:hypothetical protein [Winogradskya humida]|uniref:Uncharacterized protein n=1 Tax=Winogradskya humida TaxID=113566 RepID=A0ABQ3ZV26_9ACTN|nr:hypothetical protein [Actinoplanes humidus]GIE22389.1 hypothetical protein Ahu01nite_054910 [Actinoplanes humidus]
MIIPGYLDGSSAPLADGAELMADAAFWPAFLAFAGGSSAALATFDGDRADLSHLLDVLEDPARWPVFPLRLGEHRLHVVMRNMDGDYGCDYILEPAGGDRSIPIAALEGCFRGPGLSWPELITAAAHPDDTLTRAERLLLLLPACGDTATPASATRTVSQALTQVGVRTGQGAIATELLNHPGHWPRADWAVAGGVRVCLGKYSYRRAGELSTADLTLTASAFDPCGG